MVLSIEVRLESPGFPDTSSVLLKLYAPLTIGLLIAFVGAPRVNSAFWRGVVPNELETYNWEWARFYWIFIP